MIRARRSIRRFTNTPIPRDTIEKVLQALRYAPSASNAQSWNYIVLTDPPQIKSFTDKVMNVIYLLRKILKFKSILRFFVSGGTKQVLLDPRTLIKVNRMIADYEAGQDVIFYNAPCVIILHAPKYGGMAGVDAGVALTHGIFAAQSLNIGTCWVGYAQEAIQRIKKLRKWLQIPKKRNCYGVLALGYPAVKYQRSPPRKVLQVQWID
jgi:nitroreductase